MVDKVDKKLIDNGVVINNNNMLNNNAITVNSISDYPNYSMWKNIYDVLQYDTTRTVDGKSYTVHIVEVEEKLDLNGYLTTSYATDIVVKGNITNISDASAYLAASLSFGVSLATSGMNIIASTLISTVVSAVISPSEPTKVISGSNALIADKVTVDEYAKFVYLYDTASSKWALLATANYTYKGVLLSYTYKKSDGRTAIGTYTINAFEGHSFSDDYFLAPSKAISWYLFQKAAGYSLTPMDLRLLSTNITYQEPNKSAVILKTYPLYTPLLPGMLPAYPRN